MFTDETSPVVGTAKTDSCLTDFTNTFVLSSTSDSEQVLLEVPKALSVDLSRQRRAHQKLRAGCENCRRRRVKCSEETPCASCTRRGERCQRRRPFRGSGLESIPSRPARNFLPSSASGLTDASVNLLHLRLFHHFQTCTSQTLSFSPEAWEHALQLSFQFEFLMNSILSVAARHLTVLRPEDATYPTAAANHLCRALSLFRHELSNNFISTHIDAFVATSILLQYEVWATTDYSSNQADDMALLEPPSDRIFAFSSSLKQVLLKSVQLVPDQPSVFISRIRCDPTDALARVSKISKNTLAHYHQFFSYQRPISPDLLNIISLPCTPGSDVATSNPSSQYHHIVPESREDAPGSIKDGYVPAITRLSLLLSFLPDARPQDSVNTESPPPLFPELVRYILLFPIMCHGPFASIVQQSDPHALLLLYHFYRAVRILLPQEKCWWAHRRAAVSETALKKWLIGESVAKPTYSV